MFCRIYTIYSISTLYVIFYSFEVTLLIRLGKSFSHKTYKIGKYININILLILRNMRRTRKMPKNNEGTKTIKLGIYFWTNIDDKEKEEIGIEMPKKTCWDSGYINIVSNNRHGIRSGTFSHFKNIDDIPKAIKSVLKRSGVKVVLSAKDKEYKDALKKMKESELISN